ncbi:MAG: dihydropteroate synthase [Dehalococcoidales bacterium]|nr:dihydropteroate synthase [Dehalococcoidales bacterium]
MKTVLTPTKCGTSEFRWGEKTYIMGVVNLSPDSFSGDGIGGDIERTVAQARRMVEEGADIIDVGGESTRPGTEPLSIEEVEAELALVIPAIKRLVREISVPISIDTYKSRVAVRALEAGAVMINDIWGLKQDPALARLAAEKSVPVILMANERDAPPKTGIVAKVLADLQNGIDIGEAAGVPPQNIIVDPGIGFGKTLEQNLEMVNRLAELKALGKPILLGTSRKSMIGLVLDQPPDKRLEGNLAVTAIGIANGADIVRVHDVKETALVCRMSDAIIRRGSIGE